MSAYSVSNACGVIALLLSHQTVLSVTPSRTENLSLGGKGAAFRDKRLAKPDRILNETRGLTIIGNALQILEAETFGVKSRIERTGLVHRFSSLFCRAGTKLTA